MMYNCQACGAGHLKWSGRCSQCQKWNTLVEEIPLGKKAKKTKAAQAQSLDKTFAPFRRSSTGIKEVDRVLGGGLVQGSYVLLGGSPGVGKSTLLTQISGGLSSLGSVLYVCSEESLEQTSLRAKRLGLSGSKILLLNESSIELALEKAKNLKPRFMIIDSIQSVYLPELSSAPGTVSQVRECSHLLMEFAKSTGTSVIIIGHVTKDGSLAGPRVLEHIVDVVLSFEGDAGHRILRASKNRFGAVDEFGVFKMSPEGLEEVPNPSEFFLEERGENRIGSAVFTSVHGQRPLLCEIQALTLRSFLTLPRRTSLGMDINRLHMILAIAEKYFEIELAKYDIFLNLVGGLKINETASDLSTLASLLSSYYKKPLQAHSCFFGEIGLTGELRSCPLGEKRVQEAEKLGFQCIYMPEGNKKRLPSSLKKTKDGSKIQLKGIKNILDLKSLF